MKPNKIAIHLTIQFVQFANLYTQLKAFCVGFVV